MYVWYGVTKELRESESSNCNKGIIGSRFASSLEYKDVTELAVVGWWWQRDKMLKPVTMIYTSNNRNPFANFIRFWNDYGYWKIVEQR